MYGLRLPVASGPQAEFLNVRAVALAGLQLACVGWVVVVTHLRNDAARCVGEVDAAIGRILLTACCVVLLAIAAAASNYAFERG